LGLSNTQARLRQLYGSAHRFELLTPEEGGVEVVLSIPWRAVGGATATTAEAATSDGVAQTSGLPTAAAARV